MFLRIFLFALCALGSEAKICQCSCPCKYAGSYCDVDGSEPFISSDYLVVDDQLSTTQTTVNIKPSTSVKPVVRKNSSYDVYKAHYVGNFTSNKSNGTLDLTLLSSEEEDLIPQQLKNETAAVVPVVKHALKSVPKPISQQVGKISQIVNKGKSDSKKVFKIRKIRSVDCPVGIHRCQSGYDIFRAPFSFNRCTGSFTLDEDYSIDFRKIMEKEYYSSGTMFDRQTDVADYPNGETKICKGLGYEKGYQTFNWKDWKISSDVTASEMFSLRYLGAVRTSQCVDANGKLLPVLQLWHRYSTVVNVPAGERIGPVKLKITNQIDRSHWSWTVILFVPGCDILQTQYVSGDCRISICAIAD